MPASLRILKCARKCIKTPEAYILTNIRVIWHGFSLFNISLHKTSLQSESEHLAVAKYASIRLPQLRWTPPPLTRMDIFTCVYIKRTHRLKSIKTDLFVNVLGCMLCYHLSLFPTSLMKARGLIFSSLGDVLPRRWLA